ncbi:MAG: lipopolysaccharide biosynthesis protein [Anaerolineae bacterium]
MPETPPAIAPEIAPAAAPQALPESGLGLHVVAGATWSVGGTLLRQAIILAAAVIVARLLTPADYAIGGLALSMMALFNVLTAQGFAQALIQRPELTDLACDSVFWLTSAAGVVVAGGVALAAPILARFYQQPALQTTLLWLALGLVIGMIGTVPNTLLQRAMRFRAINLVALAAGVISAGLGVAAAWLGHGYWALILPSIGSNLAVALGAFWLTAYRPALRFRWAEIRQISTFGLALLGSNLVQYFSDNSDYLIMPRFWTPTTFGHYYFAFERARQPFNLTVAQLGVVFFPAFSRLQGERERLRRAYLQSTEFICLIVFPLHVLLIGLADPLVPWLFGEQWRPAVPAFQLFAAYSFMRGLGTLVSPALLAINRAPAALWFNLFRLVLTVPALLVLGAAGADVTTVALVLLVVWMVQAPFFIGYLYRQIDLHWRETWRGLRRLVLATSLMAAILVGSRWGAAAAGWPLWTGVAGGGLLSVLTFLTLTRSPILEGMAFVRRALRPATSPPASSS